VVILHEADVEIDCNNHAVTSNKPRRPIGMVHLMKSRIKNQICQKHVDMADIERQVEEFWLFGYGLVLCWVTWAF